MNATFSGMSKKSGKESSILYRFCLSTGYDARGNILNITRNGMYDTGSGFEDVQIDNMTLGYQSGTNKLKTVTDAAPCPDNKVLHQAMDNTELHAVGQTIEADNLVNETADIIYQAGTSVTLKAGFHAKAGTDFVAKIDVCPSGNYETGGFVQRSTNDYLYDINGNMVNDPNKGITNILFNYYNQPYKVIWENGNTIEWLYDGGGQKLQQLTKRNGVEIGKLDYLGGDFEYEKDTLERIYLADAKLTFDKGNIDGYLYFHKDHLMSTRVVFEDGGGGVASIISEHHTYAFGLAFDGDFATNSSTKRLYNFKEEVSSFGLGWADFGERYYLGNGGIPRFLSVDPIANSYPHISPFNYAENEPVANIDLWGLQKFNVTARAFIPQKTLANPNPLSSIKSFAGDNRTQYDANSNSFRVEQSINLDFDNSTSHTLSNIASSTVGLDGNDNPIRTSEAGLGGIVTSDINDGIGTVSFSMEAENKISEEETLGVTPGISLSGALSLTPTEGGGFSFSLDISNVDGFPAYEIFVTDENGNSSLIFGRNPIESGEGPLSLFGKGEHSFKFNGSNTTSPQGPIIDFKDQKNPE